ncbi:uncharacterized protein [Heterodontus francisci]|uniref:uncharacterized protein n=1 Tax=Heterodontus francisci TaxID=7792 RepID=UPI00355C7FB6
MSRCFLRTPPHMRPKQRTPSFCLRTQELAPSSQINVVITVVSRGFLKGIACLLWIYTAFTNHIKCFLRDWNLQHPGSETFQHGSTLGDRRLEATREGALPWEESILQEQEEDAMVSEPTPQQAQEDGGACVVRVSMSHLSSPTALAASEGQMLVHYETQPSMMANLLSTPWRGTVSVRGESGGRSVIVEGEARDVVEVLRAAASGQGPPTSVPGALPLTRAYRVYQRLFQGEVAMEFPAVDVSPPDAHGLLTVRGSPADRVTEAHRRVHGLLTRLRQIRLEFPEGHEAEEAFLRGCDAGELEALIVEATGVQVAVETGDGGTLMVCGLDSDDLQGAVEALRAAVSSQLFESGDASGSQGDLQILVHFIQEWLKTVKAQGRAPVHVQHLQSRENRFQLLVVGFRDQAQHLGRRIERRIQTLAHTQEDLLLTGFQLNAYCLAQEALILDGLKVGVEVRETTPDLAVLALRGRRKDVTQARRSLERLLGSFVPPGACCPCDRALGRLQAQVQASIELRCTFDLGGGLTLTLHRGGFEDWELEEAGMERPCPGLSVSTGPNSQIARPRYHISHHVLKPSNHVQEPATHVPELSRSEEEKRQSKGAVLAVKAFGERILASLQQAETKGFQTAILCCSNVPGLAGQASDSLVQALKELRLSGQALKHIIILLVEGKHQELAQYQEACVRQWRPNQFTLLPIPRKLPDLPDACIRGAIVEFTSEFIQDLKTDILVSPIILGKGLASTASSRALLHKGHRDMEILFQFITKGQLFQSGEIAVASCKTHTELQHEFVYFAMWEPGALSAEQKLKALRRLFRRSLQLCHTATLSSIAFPVSDLCSLGFRRAAVVDMAVEEIARFEEHRPCGWIRHVRLVLQPPQPSSPVVLQTAIKHFLERITLHLPEDASFVKYLEEHKEVRGQIQAELLNSGSHLETDGGGGGVEGGSGQVFLFPTSVRNLGSWKEVAQRAYRLSRGFYQVSRWERGAEAEEGEGEVASWLRETPGPVARYGQRDGKGGEGRVLVGPTQQVERAAREEAERRPERRTRPLGSLAQYLAVQGLFERRVKEAWPAVQLDLEPERPALTLSGPSGQVRRAEDALCRCTARLLAAGPAHLSGPQAAFLGRLEPHGFTRHHFFRRGLAVALETGGTGGVTLYSLDGSQLSEAQGLLCQLLNQVVLKVPRTVWGNVKEAEWQEILASHWAADRVSVEVSPGQAVTQGMEHSHWSPALGDTPTHVTVVGFREETEQATASISSFLVGHTQVAWPVQLTRPEWVLSFDRLLEVLGLSDLGRHVQIHTQHHQQPTVTLRGLRKEVEKARKTLEDGMRALTSGTVVLHEPGADEYLESGRGQQELEAVSRACKCLIIRQRELQEGNGGTRWWRAGAEIWLPDGVRVLVAEGDVTAQDVDTLIDVGMLEESSGEATQCGGNMTMHGGMPMMEAIDVGRATKCLEAAAVSALERAECQGARSVALAYGGVPGRRLPPALAAGCLVSAVQAFCRRLRCGSFRQASVRSILLVGGQEAALVSALRRASSEAWSLDAERCRESLQTVVVTGRIEDETTDVVVSPMNSNLNLESSAVSVAILQRAREGSGTILVAPAQQLKEGEVVEMPTSHCRSLNFAFVYYVYCRNWSDNGRAEQLLRTNVRKCLERCHDSGLAFITFPLLGTGGLGFPRSVTCKVLLEEIFRFTHDYRLTSVKGVRVLVHPDDTSSLPILQETMKKLQDPMMGMLQVSRRIGKILRENGKKPVLNFTEVIESPQELKPVVLEIVARQSQQVQSTRHQLDRLFADTFSEVVIRDEGLSQLTRAEVAQIQRLSSQRLVHLLLKRGSENEVTLRGLAEGTRRVSNLVRLLLKSRLERTLQGRIYDLLASVVQWQLQEGGRVFVPFDKESNYRIEEDYSTKKPSTTISFRGRQYHLHPDQLEGEELDTGCRVRLKRLELFTENRLPSYWDDMHGNLFLIVELQQSSEEYKMVSSKFQESNLSDSIVKIVRIQNIYLRLAFDIRKRALEAQGGLGASNEKLLFHGTNGRNCDSINRHGFNRSLAGKNGTAYGLGVYFAVNASQSISYSGADGSGYKHMYLSRVLTGRSVRGSNNLQRLPCVPGSSDLYDSAVDSPEQPTIFVVFHDTQVYAEYLITFH